MSWTRLLVEKRAGFRFQLSRAGMPLLRQAFAHIGRNTVIIKPMLLQGVARISVGDDVIIRDGAWLR